MSNFKVGQKVIYSDLSPWEVCKILSPSTEEYMDWVVDFWSSEKGEWENDPISVQEDGMREYTLENIEKYL